MSLNGGRGPVDDFGEIDLEFDDEPAGDLSQGLTKKLKKGLEASSNQLNELSTDLPLVPKQAADIFNPIKKSLAEAMKGNSMGCLSLQGNIEAAEAQLKKCLLPDKAALEKVFQDIKKFISKNIDEVKKELRTKASAPKKSLFTREREGSDSDKYSSSSELNSRSTTRSPQQNN